MAHADKYKPVNCDFVDVVEHYATLRKEVKLTRIIDGETQSSIIKIKTWVNDGVGEYLITSEGDRIRMDHIQTLEGHSPFGNSDGCHV